MSKAQLTFSSALLAVAMVVAGGIVTTAGAARQAPPQPASAQPSPDHPTVTPLAGLVAASPTEPWASEVRIPVIVENDTSNPLPAELTALGGLEFALVDGAGRRHGLDNLHPQRAALPNHSLRYIDPAMSARWTLGFTVPSVVASGLILELHNNGGVIASWDVDELGSAAPAADASQMAGATVGLGDTFSWQEGVTATAAGVGARVCGDPAIEAVTQVVAVTLQIENAAPEEIRWPGYPHRDATSVAQWADGTAADVSMETYVGGEESLPRISTFAVRIPAGTTTKRALVFAAPRDGRFTDPASLPEGVMLATASGYVWLSLVGANADVPISPIFCDIGFFGGPVPFGYSPGARFDVGGSAPPPPPDDPDRGDDAARLAVMEALAAAALFYDGNGQSFAGMTGRDLVAEVPRLTFQQHEVGEEITGAEDTVYFALPADDDQFIYVATRSETGRWFCASAVPHRSVAAADGTSLTEISETCNTTAPVDG